jgi:membrane complex biogenesis BtpA family protein
MKKFSDLFSSPKPVIGMIHLPALPGTAAGKEACFKDLSEYALRELEVLQQGGVDGVIVENFWDLPYFPGKVPPITIASVAALAGLVINKASIPVGVNVLYNDFEAEIAIARSINAAFIRAEVFVDPAISETGIIPASAPDLIRLRAALNAEDVAILADVHGKNTNVLWSRSINESAIDAEKRGLADAIVVTGAGTGKSASIDDLRQTKEVISLPLLAGSGVKPESLSDILSVCDGAIVGSFFKQNGKIEAPTDLDRVKELMSIAKMGK